MRSINFDEMFAHKYACRDLLWGVPGNTLRCNYTHNLFIQLYKHLGARKHANGVLNFTDLGIQLRLAADL